MGTRVNVTGNGAKHTENYPTKAAREPRSLHQLSKHRWLMAATEYPDTGWPWQWEECFLHFWKNSHQKQRRTPWQLEVGQGTSQGSRGAGKALTASARGLVKAKSEKTHGYWGTPYILGNSEIRENIFHFKIC